MTGDSEAVLVMTLLALVVGGFVTLNHHIALRHEKWLALRGKIEKDGR